MEVGAAQTAASSGVDVGDELFYNYNRCLPPTYAHKVPEEGRRWLEEIKDGFATCLATHDQLLIEHFLRQMQSFLHLKYFLPCAERVLTVKLLLELLVIPKMEMRLQTICANLLVDLLGKRRLQSQIAKQLTIPWRPLYELLDVHFHPEKTVQKPSIVGVKHGCAIVTLIQIAKRFFPREATEEILEEFRPYICLTDSVIFMGIGYVSLFLPTNVDPSICCKWIPEALAYWEWLVTCLHTSYMWLELFADLTEDHGSMIDWNPYIPRIFSHVLALLNLPVGSVKFAAPEPISAANVADLFLCYESPPQSGKKKAVHNIARIIIYMLAPENSTMEHLSKLVSLMDQYYHPSNDGDWTNGLGYLLNGLCFFFARRLGDEREKKEYVRGTPLTEEYVSKFVDLMLPLVMKGLLSKRQNMSNHARSGLKALVAMQPDRVFPEAIQMVYDALGTVTETHRVQSAIEMLGVLGRTIVWRKRFNEGVSHLYPILELTLPGIDANDPHKTAATLSFYLEVLCNVTLIDSSNLPLDEKLPYSKDDKQARLSTAFFADWALKFLDRVFSIYLLHGDSNAEKPDSNKINVENSINLIIVITCQFLFMQMSEDLYRMCLGKLFNFIFQNQPIHAMKYIAELVTSATAVDPSISLKIFLPSLHRELVPDLASSGTALSSTETRWYLKMLSAVTCLAGTHLLPYRSELVEILENTLISEDKKVMQAAAVLLRQLLTSMSTVYPLERRSVSPEKWNSPEFRQTHFMHWGEPSDVNTLQFEWHLPSTEELVFGNDLMDKFCLPAVDRVNKYMEETIKAASGDVEMTEASEKPTKKSEKSKAIFLQDLYIIKNAIRSFVTPGGGDRVERDTNAGMKYHNFVLATGYQEIMARVPAERPWTKVNLGAAADLIHRICSFLLKYKEDDTAALCIISKCIYKLFDVGKGKKLLEGYRHYRDNLRDYLTQNKQYPRWLQIYRVNILHMQRISKREYDMSKYSFLLEDLVLLSTHRYRLVRRKGQKAFTSMFKHYSLPQKTQVASSILSILSSKEVPAAAVKGACHLTRSFLRTVCASWSLVKEFVYAICNSSHHDNAKAQMMLGELFALFEMNLAGPPITPVPPLTGPCIATLYPDQVSAFIAKVDPSLTEIANKAIQARTKENVEHWIATFRFVIDYAGTPALHWRYYISAAIFMALLLREDMSEFPYSRELLEFFMKGIVSDLQELRVLSVKVIVSLLWLNKRKRRREPIQSGEEAYARFVQSLKEVAHAPTEEEWGKLFFCDKNYVGWNGMIPKHKRFVYTDGFEIPKQRSASVEDMEIEKEKGDVEKMEAEDHSQWPVKDMLNPEEEYVLNTYLKSHEFWKAFFTQHKEDQRTEKTVGFSRDMSVMFKRLFQRYSDLFLEEMKPALEEILGEYTHRGSQCLAAEVVAGLLRGSKHWPYASIQKMWAYIFGPLTKTLENTSVDSVRDWARALTTAVADRDPRRYAPLTEYLCDVDAAFREGSSFNQSKRLRFLESVLNEIGWRHLAANDAVFMAMGKYLDCPYQLVRSQLGSLLCSTIRSPFTPLDPITHTAKLDLVVPPHPLTEMFVQNIVAVFEKCKADGLHQLNTNELETLNTPEAISLRNQRINYVNFAKTISGWTLLVMISGFSHAMYPYLHKLLPMLFDMYKDTDTELSDMAIDALGLIVKTRLPPQFIEPILEVLLSLLTGSTMWRIRALTLPILQVLVFQYTFFLPPEKLEYIINATIRLLQDSQLEVRDLASTTLTGFLTFVDADTIQKLRETFIEMAGHPLPKRVKGKQPVASEAHVIRHAGVLGMAAIVGAFPYTVPQSMPSLLLLLAKHVNDPLPISATVKKTFLDFWRTHQDAFHLFKPMFTEEELRELTQLLVSPTYFA